ncbi:MAG: hypothetical protein ACRES6_07565 [Steroidobacteraceae bacterium]
MSKAVSAAVLFWPAGSTAPLAAEEALLVDAAGAVETAGVDGTPASAPASACSRSARADETGSVAESFVGGALESPAPAGWGLAAEVSAVAVPPAGVAASDWARAAEKSLVSAAAVACAAAACSWVEPVLDAPEERAVRRPEPEAPLE